MGSQQHARKAFPPPDLVVQSPPFREFRFGAVMPKQKTNKAAKKRFRVSKNGKVKRNRPGKRHLLSSMSTKRKRKMRKQQICPKADGERVLRLLLKA